MVSKCNNIDIREATKCDFDIQSIDHIVHTTIRQIYPKYYPSDVVQFFADHHAIDRIEAAVEGNDEYILILSQGKKDFGTGALYKNEIKRMFILPEFQNKGYGSLLLDALERKAVLNQCAFVVLDASLPAYDLYSRRQYKLEHYHKIITPLQQVLCYHSMKKTLDSDQDMNHRL